MTLPSGTLTATAPALPPATSAPLEEPRDLGFGSVIGGVKEQRLVNRDGTFNQRRDGRSFLSSLSLYHFFLTMSWGRFLGIVTATYIAANAVFALGYLLCGAGSLAGADSSTMGGEFWKAFFFSVHTFATIGYGNIVPVGMAANLLVTLESLVGLLGFALGTGILFSRFSRPVAALLFSSRAVVAPYRGTTGFMFRLTNGRSNQIIELEAKVMFTRVEKNVRKYDQLALERTKVVFFPLGWTVVHPIDEKSPLFGLTHQDLVERAAEFMILMTGIDETFSQTVHARTSYKASEVVHGYKFANMYKPLEADGVVRIDVRTLSDIVPATADDGVPTETSSWHNTGHFAGFTPPRR